MVRKASASAFLVMMSLLIVLRSPVFGYCPEYEVFFVADSGCPFAHNCEDREGCHHSEDCHHDEDCPHPEDREEPDQPPCDENHEMLMLESEDFLWNGISDSGEGKMSPISEFDSFAIPVFEIPRRGLKVISPSRAPPPPEGPIFLRFSVLRL